jgi:hypothetical protein
MLTGVMAMSPVVSSNKNILLIEKKRMQNPAMIVVLLQEGQEGLNISEKGSGP